jgi:sortase A
MKRASKGLRRAEIALWIIGASLLGVALGATIHRWMYQAEQERAFLRVAAASENATREGSPPPSSAPSLFETPDGAAMLPGETFGPPAPEVTTAGAPEATEAEPPQGVTTGSRTAGPAEGALDEGVLGRIEIPRIGLSAIVREGDDDATLRKAVGFVPGTARPGEGGNTALAGHRDTFFRPLRRIEVGDRIRLVVPPATYEYRVASLDVVEPTEVSVLASRGEEELTLVTCYPFRWIGPAPDRYIVKATRVEKSQ